MADGQWNCGSIENHVLDSGLNGLHWSKNVMINRYCNLNTGELEIFIRHLAKMLSCRPLPTVLPKSDPDIG